MQILNKHGSKISISENKRVQKPCELWISSPLFSREYGIQIPNSKIAYSAYSTSVIIYVRNPKNRLISSIYGLVFLEYKII